MKPGIRRGIVTGSLESKGSKEKLIHKYQTKEEIKQCTTCPYKDCKGGKHCKRIERAKKNESVENPAEKAPGDHRS